MSCMFDIKACGQFGFMLWLQCVLFLCECFLCSFRTTHEFLFGALAELLDNARWLVFSLWFDVFLWVGWPQISYLGRLTEKYSNDRARVDRLVCRWKRRGFLSAETSDVATLVSEAVNRLCQAILADPNHVLRKHSPDIKRSNYNLRPRAHEFTLPLKDDRNFIPRLLFFRHIIF